MPSYSVRTRIGLMRVRGELGDHCADCADVATNLCDYPIGGDKTCDRKICEHHSHVVGQNMHYCNTHFRQWQKDNPDLPEYRHTHLSIHTLPSMAHVAVLFLKEEFDRRYQGKPGEQSERILSNCAIPLGTDAQRAALGPVGDGPHESLAAGLRWCIEHGLVNVCWRKPPGFKEQPWFALSQRGLSLIEGNEVVVEEGNPD